MTTQHADFSATLAQIEAHIASETIDTAIDPRCVSAVMHHGHATTRSIILLHGFTNCPRQFTQLADAFFARGFNVYTPRLPRHGLRDKLTTELAGLTVDELTDCAERATAFARGLGTSVSVVGLSLGGTLAAWLAQTQPIERAVIVAPFFSVVRVPTLLEPLVEDGLALAPNLEVWWDPRVREAALPDHAYPRFATHALAACLALGQRVRAAARDAAPAADRTILVTNAKDPAIDNGAARDVLELWTAHGAATGQYVFETLDVRHDIIEPTTFPAAASVVYPVLIDLMTA